MIFVPMNAIVMFHVALVTSFEIVADVVNLKLWSALVVAGKLNLRWVSMQEASQQSVQQTVLSAAAAAASSSAARVRDSIARGGGPGSAARGT